MDEDDTMQAWAHQLELEHQQFEEMLAADPGYLEWLEQLEQKNYYRRT